MFGAKPHPRHLLGAEHPRYLVSQLITYIGNKRKLIDFIGAAVTDVAKRTGKDKISCWDAFSGSGVVARYLKQHSSYLYCSDQELYSERINRCYLSNKSEVDLSAVRKAVREINREAQQNPQPGIIRELYSPRDDKNIQPGERVFYTSANATFIDTVRKLIDGHEYENLLIGPLLHKASVHTNTSGVFKGFYKNSKTGVGQFGGNGRQSIARITGRFVLEAPILSEFQCPFEFIRDDANSIASDMDVDLAYFDPPYNQHAYGSNYFMLNVIAEYQRPKNLSPVSGIPSDWNKSAYNNKQTALDAFADLIEKTRASYILVSCNTDGLIDEKQMLSILQRHGRTEVFKREYNVFRGSRNLNQRSLYVTEMLFLLEKR